MPPDTMRVPLTSGSPVLSILPFPEGSSLLTSQHLAFSCFFESVQLTYPNGSSSLSGVCPTRQAMPGSRERTRQGGSSEQCLSALAVLLKAGAGKKLGSILNLRPDTNLAVLSRTQSF